MNPAGYVPRTAAKVKLSMLREEHFRIATDLFGTDEIDRLFVLHAIDALTREELAAKLAGHGIHILTVHKIVRDLRDWYKAHSRPTGLRHTLVEDLWHLLVGYSGLDLAQ